MELDSVHSTDGEVLYWQRSKSLPPVVVEALCTGSSDLYGTDALMFFATKMVLDLDITDCACLGRNVRT